MMLGHGAGVGGGAAAGRGGALPSHGNGGNYERNLSPHLSPGQWQSLDDDDGHNKTIHSKLWFGSWFVAGGWRGSGEAAAEHADGAVQQAGAAGLQRVPGSPAQVRADSAADHRRGECP